MRIILTSVLLAMGLLLTGCYATCDARGPSEICEVHHTFMRTVTIKNKKNPAPTMEYLVARQQMFPHSYPFVLPDQCTKDVIYLCDDCAKAEKEWKRAHPDIK